MVCTELHFHLMVMCKEYCDCPGQWTLGTIGSVSYSLNSCSSWKPCGSDSVQRQHLTHSFSGSDGASDQVKAFSYIFSSVEREQAGKQQIIKLMSTFIAVKAVKASHGFLIKSHKVYLQSHIIFLVIQTRNCL